MSVFEEFMINNMVKQDALIDQLKQEKQSHDAEIRRIANEVGLEWPTTIEDIVKAIRSKTAVPQRPAGLFTDLGRKQLANTLVWGASDAPHIWTKHQIEQRIVAVLERLARRMEDHGEGNTAVPDSPSQAGLPEV